MTTAAEAFDRACKRAEKLIAKLAAEGGRENEQAACKATDRLFELYNGGDLRGQEAIYKRAVDLHRSRVAAAEQGHKARLAALETAAGELRAKHKASLPAPGTEEHELAVFHATSALRRR